MYKALVLYGASNPCVLKILNSINRKTKTWKLIGFIDDTPEKSGGTFYGIPILGSHVHIDSLDIEKTFFFNNVFGSMPARRKVAQVLEEYGCRYITLVHPDTDLTFVDVGTDVAIEQHAAIDADVRIGDHCCIKRNASVGHETKLENFVFIGPGATVCGRVEISEGAYVGAGSCISPELKIGRDSVIGAGSVVIRDVPAGVTVIGNPAKILE